MRKQQRDFGHHGTGYLAWARAVAIDLDVGRLRRRNLIQIIFWFLLLERLSGGHYAIPFYVSTDLNNFILINWLQNQIGCATYINWSSMWRLSHEKIKDPSIIIHHIYLIRTMRISCQRRIKSSIIKRQIWQFLSPGTSSGALARNVNLSVPRSSNVPTPIVQSFLHPTQYTNHYYTIFPPSCSMYQALLYSPSCVMYQAVSYNPSSILLKMPGPIVQSFLYPPQSTSPKPVCFRHKLTFGGVV